MVVSPEDPVNYWDERYSAKAQIWSGRPNAALVESVTGLTPGRALDLGCGEGADSIWLAEQGWDVTAVDISAVALERGRREQESRQLRPWGPSAIDWRQADLTTWEPPQTYELIAASYLHSPSEALSRYSLIRRYSAWVEPGGFLFTLAHATFPPGHELPAHLQDLDHSPQIELRRLRLDPDAWEVVSCTRFPRELPEGTVWDNLVLLRRLSAVA